MVPKDHAIYIEVYLTLVSSENTATYIFYRVWIENQITINIISIWYLVCIQAFSDVGMSSVKKIVRYL